ncbi:MAG: peptide chain release factor N(5)-glutamine methyltransferase [Alphaproteobacteria bacterium]
MSVHCTWREILSEARERLTAAGVEAPQREARLLLADALGIDGAGLIAQETDAIDAGGLDAFEARMRRRLAGEPISRIRGWREFYGRRFAITGDVLDPRPETELLVEEGQMRLPRGGCVLDLGTGSGCILVSMLAERPDAIGVGVDISPAALAVAASNAGSLDVADRATFIEGGWGAMAEGGGAGFDLVLSNPPYVTEAEFTGLAVEVRDHDPHLALVGGVDGLDPYRAILAALPATLKPGGWLGVEFGATQGGAVSALMVSAGLDAVEVMADFAGLDRVAFGRRPMEAS